MKNEPIDKAIKRLTKTVSSKEYQKMRESFRAAMQRKCDDFLSDLGKDIKEKPEMFREAAEE